MHLHIAARISIAESVIHCLVTSEYIFRVTHRLKYVFAYICCSVWKAVASNRIIIILIYLLYELITMLVFQDDWICLISIFIHILYIGFLNSPTGCINI